MGALRRHLARHTPRLASLVATRRRREQVEAVCRAQIAAELTVDAKVVSLDEVVLLPARDPRAVAGHARTHTHELRQLRAHDIPLNPMNPKLLTRDANLTDWA